MLTLRRETPEAGKTGQGAEEGLDPSWKSALRYAEAATKSGHAVSDSSYEELSGFWRESEIIEITMVIGLFSYFNRVNDALKVDITK